MIAMRPYANGTKTGDFVPFARRSSIMGMNTGAFDSRSKRITDVTDEFYTRDDSSQRSASLTFAESAAPVPTLPAFDAAKYRTHLEDLALTADQERELLKTLWSIMYSFVELGFRVDVCTALFGEPENIAGGDSAVVGSTDPRDAETTATNTAEDGPA